MQDFEFEELAVEDGDDEEEKVVAAAGEVVDALAGDDAIPARRIERIIVRASRAGRR